MPSFTNKLAVFSRVVAVALLCTVVPSSRAADDQPRWRPKQDSLFGGKIQPNDGGDPSLLFEGKNGWNVDISLVLYRGQPAFALPASVWHTLGSIHYSDGTLLIGRDFVVYAVESGSKVLTGDAFELDRNQVELTFSYGDTFRVLQFHMKAPGRKVSGEVNVCDSKQKTSLHFMQALVANFDATLSQFEAAAGLSNLEAQLSPAARYHRDSDAEIAANVQQVIDKKAADKAANGGGNGLAVLTAILTGAAQGVSGQSSSPILDTANQQAAAIRAIGDANAARQQQAVSPSRTSAAPAWRPQPGASNSSATFAANRAPASSSSTTAVSGAAEASTTPNSSSPGASLTGPQSESASADNGPHYLDPLPSTCVRQFWDPQYYNWLSLENDCSVSIYVSFIFNTPKGWAMNGSMNLAPGAHNNTGFSSSDINQAGGFQFYVCPANSVPVDPSGNILKSNVAQYTCKPL